MTGAAGAAPADPRRDQDGNGSCGAHGNAIGAARAALKGGRRSAEGRKERGTETQRKLGGNSKETRPKPLSS